MGSLGHRGSSVIRVEVNRPVLSSWVGCCHGHLSRCKVPRSKREMLGLGANNTLYVKLKWKKKGNVRKLKENLVGCLCQICHMLFQKGLDYLTSSVSKGTGIPRREKAGALRSSSVPRIAKWKCGNRQLIMWILVVYFNFMFLYVP